jgi:uncharacterized protein YdhG (YjbR/CyaY superfamily)
MPKDKKIVPGGVDEYIAACPEEVQEKLKAVRAAIREVAPDAIETVSYFQFPGYSYEGYDYNGMFVWFSYKKPYIRLHLRPPVIQDHKQKLKGYGMSKGILSFPEEAEISPALVKKLVTASLNVMKGKA